MSLLWKDAQKALGIHLNIPVHLVQLEQVVSLIIISGKSTTSLMYLED
jgi:hypothetical protein